MHSGIIRQAMLNWPTMSIFSRSWKISSLTWGARPIWTALRVRMRWPGCSRSSRWYLETRRMEEQALVQISASYFLWLKVPWILRACFKRVPLTQKVRRHIWIHMTESWSNTTRTRWYSSLRWRKRVGQRSSITMISINTKVSSSARLSVLTWALTMRT